MKPDSKIDTNLHFLGIQPTAEEEVKKQKEREKRTHMKYTDTARAQAARKGWVYDHTDSISLFKFPEKS